jgi:integrator complex subunit 11
MYNVNMKVSSMSFSAHADATGILDLVKHLEPKNVMFVHGEFKKMEYLGRFVTNIMKLPIFYPANH